MTGSTSSLSLWDETAVILTTDHGHDLGERGVFGKQYPHFDSHANRIPLFVWHPEKPGYGNSISDLTQTVDLFSTVLDFAGVPGVQATHGQSLLPVLEGKGGPREALSYGTFGQGVCVTDGRWTLFKSPQDGAPLNYYSSMLYKSLVLDTVAPPDGQGRFIPGVELPQWRVPVRVGPEKVNPGGLTDFLFDRAEDPGQKRNLWDHAPQERQRMLDLTRAVISEEGTPQSSTNASASPSDPALTLTHNPNPSNMATAIVNKHNRQSS
ncbi:MAG: sulfatase/phosphatase domain-containing protein [Rubrobacter sp.]